VRFNRCAGQKSDDVISSPLMMFQMHMMPFSEVRVLGVGYSRMCRLLPPPHTNHDYDSSIHTLNCPYKSIFFYNGIMFNFLVKLSI